MLVYCTSLPHFYCQLFSDSFCSGILMCELRFRFLPGEGLLRERERERDRSAGHSRTDRLVYLEELASANRAVVLPIGSSMRNLFCNPSVVTEPPLETFGCLIDILVRFEVDWHFTMLTFPLMTRCQRSALEKRYYYPTFLKPNDCEQ